MDLLVMQSSPPRLDDAILVLETCHKLDPYNGSISEWIEQLQRGKSAPTAARADQAGLRPDSDRPSPKATPTRPRKCWSNCSTTPAPDPDTLMGVARICGMGDLANSEKAIVRLTQIMPDNPEAWYNLANRPSLPRQKFRGHRLAQKVTEHQCRANEQRPEGAQLARAHVPGPRLWLRCVKRPSSRPLSAPSPEIRLIGRVICKNQNHVGKTFCSDYRSRLREPGKFMEQFHSKTLGRATV